MYKPVTEYVILGSIWLSLVWDLWRRHIYYIVESRDLWKLKYERAEASKIFWYKQVQDMNVSIKFLEKSRDFWRNEFDQLKVEFDKMRDALKHS